MIYMAPERLEGKQYTYAADIWSLGLTLFTLAIAKVGARGKRRGDAVRRRERWQVGLGSYVFVVSAVG